MRSPLPPPCRLRRHWRGHLCAVSVTVDYRLAPEHRDLDLVEDCYAALCWVGENLTGLDMEPARLMLAGASAGGRRRIP